ncbi:uncharacterized protein LOC126793130 [Argentina anserina]|uniref:uncharacterized protein LOC126793130 n=1 Tax=Argentina anserina TaxID=57926 RepID=UPI0021767369|nr:uncharacterized protein LOC126793130 [Potentilla anserina]
MWNYGFTRRPKTVDDVNNAAAGVAICSVLLAVIVFFSVIWKLILWGGDPLNVDFQIESATVSGLNLNGTRLTGTWDFTLVATNPNEKVTINCDTIDVSLFKHYKPYYTTNRLPSLFVNSSGHSHVDFKLGLVDHYISDSDAIDIFEETITRGLVTFQLRLEVFFTYRTKFRDVWDLEDAGLYTAMTCNPVQFVFSPNNGTGVFTGPSTVCYRGSHL